MLVIVVTFKTTMEGVAERSLMGELSID